MIVTSIIDEHPPCLFSNQIIIQTLYLIGACGNIAIKKEQIVKTPTEEKKNYTERGGYIIPTGRALASYLFEQPATIMQNIHIMHSRDLRDLCVKTFNTSPGADFNRAKVIALLKFIEPNCQQHINTLIHLRESTVEHTEIKNKKRLEKARREKKTEHKEEDRFSILALQGILYCYYYLNRHDELLTLKSKMREHDIYVFMHEAQKEIHGSTSHAIVKRFEDDCVAHLKSMVERLHKDDHQLKTDTNPPSENHKNECSRPTLISTILRFMRVYRNLKSDFSEFIVLGGCFEKTINRKNIVNAIRKYALSEEDKKSLYFIEKALSKKEILSLMLFHDALEYMEQAKRKPDRKFIYDNFRKTVNVFVDDGVVSLNLLRDASDIVCKMHHEFLPALIFMGFILAVELEGKNDNPEFSLRKEFETCIQREISITHVVQIIKDYEATLSSSSRSIANLFTEMNDIYTSAYDWALATNTNGEKKTYSALDTTAKKKKKGKRKKRKKKNKTNDLNPPVQESLHNQETLSSSFEIKGIKVTTNVGNTTSKKDTDHQNEDEAGAWELVTKRKSPKKKIPLQKEKTHGNAQSTQRRERKSTPLRYHTLGSFIKPAIAKAKAVTAQTTKTDSLGALTTQSLFSPIQGLNPRARERIYHLGYDCIKEYFHDSQSKYEVWLTGSQAKNHYLHGRVKPGSDHDFVIRPTKEITQDKINNFIDNVFYSSVFKFTNKTVLALSNGILATLLQSPTENLDFLIVPFEYPLVSGLSDKVLINLHSGEVITGIKNKVTWTRDPFSWISTQNGTQQRPTSPIDVAVVVKDILFRMCEDPEINCHTKLFKTHDTKLSLFDLYQHYPDLVREGSPVYRIVSRKPQLQALYQKSLKDFGKELERGNQAAQKLTGF